jgi:hypothetical protein
LEPEKIYFLLIVACCTVVVLLLVWRAEHKHGTRLKARKKKLQKTVQLRQKRVESAHRKSEPGPTASRPAHRLGAWEARHQRAGEETREGNSFAASRLYSDDEKARDGVDRDLAMRAIEYAPEDAPRTFRTRR